MSTPADELRAAATARQRCGMPCLKHPHACDRSPRHTGFHRDVQQKGEHTCEWDTPHPKDFPALMTALRSTRAEAERLRSREALVEDQVRIVRRQGEEETARAAYEAMDAERRNAEARRSVDNVAFADQRRERDEARAEVNRLQGWLGDYEATQARNAELKAEVEQLRGLLGDAGVQYESARARAEELLGQRDALRAERDEARTLAGVRGDLLDETRAKLERAQQAGRDVEAERDRLAEQVKRVRQELDTAHLTTDGMLIQRDSIAAAGNLQRALGIEAGANEIRRIVRRVRAALDGTEAGR
jgi:chromosome segregation ATPase